MHSPITLWSLIWTIGGIVTSLSFKLGYKICTIFSHPTYYVSTHLNWAPSCWDNMIWQPGKTCSSTISLAISWLASVLFLLNTGSSSSKAFFKSSSSCKTSDSCTSCEGSWKETCLPSYIVLFLLNKPKPKIPPLSLDLGDDINFY